MSDHPTTRYGHLALGAFFVFGAIMSAYAAVTLLMPGTFLDALWVLNKRGQAQLVSLGWASGVLLGVVSVMLCFAAVGWFRRRCWGWVLGLTIIAINALGDVGQLLFGERWKGAVGVLVAGALLVYMTRPGMRNQFRDGILRP